MNNTMPGTSAPLSTSFNITEAVSNKCHDSSNNCLTSSNKCLTSSNKCLTSSNKCLTSSNKCHASSNKCHALRLEAGLFAATRSTGPRGPDRTRN